MGTEVFSLTVKWSTFWCQVPWLLSEKTKTLAAILAILIGADGFADHSCSRRCGSFCQLVSH